MKFTMDELQAYLTQLVLDGAIEVLIEYDGDLTALRWRFSGEPEGSLRFELEEEHA